MNFKTKNILSVIFSIGGAAGTIATALLSRKAAIKENDIRKGHADFDKLKTKEKTVILGKLYLPTITTGLITVGSIIGSTILSYKTQASLMSMAALADRGWKKYKNQVKSTLGLESHADIVNKLAKNAKIKDIQKIKENIDEGLELYYDETIGYFQAKHEDVLSAYAEINEYLNTDKGDLMSNMYDGITLKMFLELANAKKIDNVSDDILDSWGWTSDYLGDVSGNQWIHLGFDNDVTEDGVVPYKVLVWVEEPIFLLEEYHIDAEIEKNRVKIEDIKEFQNLLEKDSKKNNKV